MMYYALQSNGDLFILGDHGDIEAAEETAQDIGLEVVWLADQETIEQWRGAMSEARYRRGCGQLVSVARVNENGECDDE